MKERLKNITDVKVELDRTQTTKVTLKLVFMDIDEGFDFAKSLKNGAAVYIEKEGEANESKES